jgi:hypothetical protein
MFNPFDYVPIFPAALLIATAICLPLHLMQTAAIDRQRHRSRQRAARPLDWRDQ